MIDLKTRLNTKAIMITQVMQEEKKLKANPNSRGFAICGKSVYFSNDPHAIRSEFYSMIFLSNN